MLSGRPAATKMPRTFYKQAQRRHPDMMWLRGNRDESVQAFKDVWYVSIQSIFVSPMCLYYSIPVLTAVADFKGIHTISGYFVAFFLMSHYFFS